jgi:hypothetical protein
MKHIKLFESFSDPSYERLSYDIYAQSRNKMKSVEFTKMDIEYLKKVTKGEVDVFNRVGGHKKRYLARLKGTVPFLGTLFTLRRTMKPVSLYITIDKYEDDWFFVHITVNDRIEPQSIGANEQSFWKCDQISGVIDLIKNEIKVEI